MGFLESLRRMVEAVPGAMAAAVVGTDGLVVEGYTPHGSVDLQVHGAEMATAMNAVSKAMEALQQGEVEELTVRTGQALAILRPVAAGYFTLLLLHPDGNLGKGRFVLRRATPELSKEF